MVEMAPSRAERQMPVDTEHVLRSYLPKRSVTSSDFGMSRPPFMSMYVSVSVFGSMPVTQPTWLRFPGQTISAWGAGELVTRHPAAVAPAAQAIALPDQSGYLPVFFSQK